MDTEWDGGPARTPGDAGSLKLLADRAQINAQLGTDLTECPNLGVQVSCTLNVHRDTVTSLSRIVSSLGQESAGRQFIGQLPLGVGVRRTLLVCLSA